MVQEFLEICQSTFNRISPMVRNGVMTFTEDTDCVRASRVQDPKGFSLMELLVVIALIGIIAAFGTPKLLSMRPKASVRADAKDFYSAIRVAQTEAVKRSRDVCIGMSQGAGTYRVYLAGGDDLLSKELRPGNRFDNAFTSVPCFNFRGLPWTASNSLPDSVDIENNSMRMRVELTVAGHVRSDVLTD